MSTLGNHSTGLPLSSDSKVVTSAVSGQAGPSSKHHSEPSGASGGSGAKAGMGSDRLPQGKLDSPKVP